jgi:hypothetical protein
MADTGATCSVFDLAFVERNNIPWRRRKVPVRVVSASGTLIPRAGEAYTNDCSVMVKDSDLKMDRVIPFTTEIFNLEEGIDLILGMDWLRANTTGLSWDISDRLNFRPGVGLLDGANAEKLVAQEGANAEWSRLVAQEGANTERLVVQADGANAEELVAQGEKLEVDIQVVSSLSDWDEVVAEGFAIGCIWYMGNDESASVSTLWTDSQGEPVENRLPPQYREFRSVFSRRAESITET